MKRVVIKIGSSTLCDEEGRIDHSFIEGLVGEIADLRRDGQIEPVIVTSGSIAAGLEVLGCEADRPDDMPTLQAAAACGQVALIDAYASAFAQHDIQIGQVLITRATTADRDAYLHARETMGRLLEMGLVPVINENDTIAVDEIRFGDNDTLAAMVATALSADLVVVLSDIEGLYTADPHVDEDATLLDSVSELSADIEASAGGVGSWSGSGGMVTKIAAARVLMAAGIPMVLCEGHRKDAISDAVAGKNVGTTFFDDQSAGLHARKSWIALGSQVKGRVVCDDGACKALREKGSSLLPVGITQVEGEFAQGDPVDLVDGRGRLIGRGLARYEAARLQELLGSQGAPEFVHRDDLLVF